MSMARGFLQLVAIVDWHSRCVVARRLSNTLEAGFCAESLGGTGLRQAGGVQHRIGQQPGLQLGVHPSAVEAWD